MYIYHGTRLARSIKVCTFKKTHFTAEIIWCVYHDSTIMAKRACTMSRKRRRKKMCFTWTLIIFEHPKPQGRMIMSCPWIPTVPAGQTDKKPFHILDWIGIRTNPVKKINNQKNFARHVKKIVSSPAVISARNFKRYFFWPQKEGFLQWHGQTEKQTHKLTWRIVLVKKYFWSTFKKRVMFSNENIEQIKKSIHPPHNWL